MHTATPYVSKLVRCLCTAQLVSKTGILNTCCKRGRVSLRRVFMYKEIIINPSQILIVVPCGQTSETTVKTSEKAFWISKCGELLGKGTSILHEALIYNYVCLEKCKTYFQSFLVGLWPWWTSKRRQYFKLTSLCHWLSCPCCRSSQAIIWLLTVLSPAIQRATVG